jgi:hypothetical protein
MSFWKRLALTLRLSQRLSLQEAVELLKSAVEHKVASLPLGLRNQLVLALDVGRLPALALQPVVSAFRTAHAAWVAAQEFQQVWLVGPHTRLTWRLDN